MYSISGIFHSFRSFLWDLAPLHSQSRRALSACLLPLLLTLPTLLSAQTGIEFTPEEQRFIRQHPVIVVGGEEDWPPFDFVQDGEYTGVARDYLELLEESTGLQFQVETGHTWDQLLKGLEERRFDLLPMLYWSEQRTRYIHFTRPYLYARHYVFVRRGEASITSMRDLEEKRVAIPRGYAQIEMLRRDYPKIPILEVESPLAAIDAVLTRRADALIETTALVSHLVRENKLQGIVPALATDLPVNRLYMGARKDWPLLRDILQKGLDTISDAEREQIADRWISMEVMESEPGPVAGPLPLVDEERRYLRQKGQLMACVDPAWAPLEKLENGIYSGLGADYLKLFSERIGIPIDVLPTDSWAESVAEARARRCDLFLLSVNSPSRATFMDTTRPYVKLPLVLATRPEVLFISELDEIGKRRIGIIEGYALADLVLEKYPDLELVPVPSNRVGMQRVADGELFGLLDTLPSIAFAIQNRYIGELKIGGRFGIDWELGVATRNDEPILGRLFERVVQSVDANTREEILNRWTAVNYTQRFDYTLLWQVVGLFSVVLLLFVYRNRQLVRHRLEIQEKNNQLAEINQRLSEQKNRIEYLAEHDVLTGLPNRQSLLQRLDHGLSLARRREQKLALMFIDLDRFKNINDTLGHDVGDEVLKCLAEKMKGVLRDSDTLVRVGGDEFILLMEAISGDDEPGVVAEKIQRVVNQPIQVREYSLDTTASIGIAVYPDDGEDANTLIKNADSAMYSAKDAGKDNYQYYTHSLSEQIHRRLFIERELRHAIERKQLTLVFQPQIALESEAIVGAEALLRWQHPELGSVSPDEFIPIAEDSGLIVSIGEWVFLNACRAFLECRESGCDLQNISINVSSVQFSQSDIASSFSNIIRQLGIPASCIDIEITERYIMEHTEQNSDVLETLRRIGFRISVDDFGTGYSSMSYLKLLPLDTIKIDKAFVDDIPHDINDVQITRAILALSHSLGYSVVAEGIEREEQLRFLRRAGCTFGQGYLFSRPIPLPDLVRYVTDYRNRPLGESLVQP
ncbi:MAG: EAL domain-containing protein [Sedimenticola sp.]|nr:EAL domain-containing protein [Sedimenticola sp.]